MLLIACWSMQLSTAATRGRRWPAAGSRQTVQSGVPGFQAARSVLLGWVLSTSLATLSIRLPMQAGVPSAHLEGFPVRLERVARSRGCVNLVLVVPARKLPCKLSAKLALQATSPPELVAHHVRFARKGASNRKQGPSPASFAHPPESLGYWVPRPRHSVFARQAPMSRATAPEVKTAAPMSPASLAPRAWSVALIAGRLGCLIRPGQLQTIQGCCLATCRWCNSH
mmetsp:Transcript_51969/g.123712  ORF Transcript_51969/g.123712 Transcript_51969/m.123712 type:complete len:226 (-) Transcript_51969:2718-3395(-)